MGSYNYATFDCDDREKPTSKQKQLGAEALSIARKALPDFNHMCECGTIDCLRARDDHVESLARAIDAFAARVHNDAIEAAARVGIAHESGPVNECTLLAETIRALKVPHG